mgnify:CR=1 FL=1
MIKRKVRFISPKGPANEKSTDVVRTYTSIVSHPKEKNVYATVEKFREEVFPGITEEKFREETLKGGTPLRGLINLHNADEIRRRETSVGEMRDKIQSGDHVLMPDGMPNVKIVRTTKDELVCFDGHHSLLAYMAAGKKYLHEVPHLLVTRQSGKGLKDEEIRAFFGDYGEELHELDWRDYTISWTNPPEDQLERRKQENMGELFLALNEALYK